MSHYQYLLVLTYLATIDVQFLREFRAFYAAQVLNNPIQGWYSLQRTYASALAVIRVPDIPH